MIRRFREKNESKIFSYYYLFSFLKKTNIRGMRVNPHVPSYDQASKTATSKSQKARPSELPPNDGSKSLVAACFGHLESVAPPM